MTATTDMLTLMMLAGACRRRAQSCVPLTCCSCGGAAASACRLCSQCPVTPVSPSRLTFRGLLNV
jgi:hypothetical protein